MARHLFMTSIGNAASQVALMQHEGSGLMVMLGMIVMSVSIMSLIIFGCANCADGKPGKSGGRRRYYGGAGGGSACGSGSGGGGGGGCGGGGGGGSYGASKPRKVDKPQKTKEKCQKSSNRGGVYDGGMPAAGVYASACGGSSTAGGGGCACGGGDGGGGGC
nr:loricrin-like [Coffea arabica]